MADRGARRPPQATPLFSEQAERNVIGVCLADTRVFWEAYGRLKPEHFATSRLSRIWEAMCRMADKSKPINRNYVQLFIRNDGGEETPIGMFLALLMNDSVDATADIEVDIATVFGLANKRALVDSLERAKLEILGVDVGVSVEQMQDYAIRSVTRAVGDDFDEYMKTYHAWGQQQQQQVEEAYARGEDGYGVGYKPGLRAVEEVTGQLLGGKVYVLAGMSSSGKSALARMIAEAVAREARERKAGWVYVASLEMSGKEYATRHLSERVGIPASTIEQGSLNSGQIEVLSHAVEKMKNLDLIIDAKPRMTGEDIRARALRVKHRRGLSMIVADHILLMGTGRKQDTLTERVMESTIGAKHMAKEFNVPVVLLSQVDEKKLMEGGSGFPNSTHLFGGQAIQQNTDVTLFVHRPVVILGKREPSMSAKPAKWKEGDPTSHEKWVSDMDKHAGTAYVYNQKRRGGTGNVKRELHFDGPTMTFSDL